MHLIEELNATRTIFPQLVQQGRLTQAQADQLKSALSNAGSSPCAGGRFGSGFGPFGIGTLPFAGGPGHGAWHVDATAVLNAAASALKLDTQSLLSSLRSGQDLKAIAQKQGVDYATVTSAIHDAVKTQLDTLVTQGHHHVRPGDDHPQRGRPAAGERPPGVRLRDRGSAACPAGSACRVASAGTRHARLVRRAGRRGAEHAGDPDPHPSPTPQAPSSQG